MLDRILFPHTLFAPDPPAAGSEPDPDPAPDPAKDPDPEPDPDPDPPKGEPDWKAEARKHERRAKQERKRAEEMERREAERAAENQTETEKAIAAAKEEGRKAADADNRKVRRDDRLEVAATRLASRGVKVGDGDNAKTVKFADPEDALAAIQRRIAAGDVDADELFSDDDRIQTDLLETELADVLSKRPHLAGSGANGGPPGDPDLGKGSPATGDLSEDPEAHAKRKYSPA